MGRLVLVAGFITGVTLAASSAFGQSRFQYLGPNECLNCHDHQDERQWYEKLEIPEVRKRFPQKSANAGHINSLKQLEAAKSDDFARAIGLKSKYDVGGSCVRCHATVFQGDANAGVSCESCHGPGSGYLKPHQTKGAYAQSLPLGMVDIVGKVAAWAQQCTTCHVMDDQRLITAGHPSGDDFDLGAMFAPVSLHFSKKYGETDVRGISSDIVRSIVAKRRGTPAAAPAAAVPASSPPAPAVSAAAAPPSALPQRDASPVPVASPPAAASTPAVASRTPPVAAPRAVTTPVTPPAAAPTVAVAVPVAPPAPAVVAPLESLPASSSAAVAVVQGRLITMLTGLLQSGATAPLRSNTPLPPLAPYNGPDAALLQLQRDAIALALEVLSTPPPAPAAPR